MNKLVKFLINSLVNSGVFVLITLMLSNIVQVILFELFDF